MVNVKVEISNIVVRGAELNRKIILKIILKIVSGMQVQILDVLYHTDLDHDVSYLHMSYHASIKIRRIH